MRPTYVSGRSEQILASTEVRQLVTVVMTAPAASATRRKPPSYRNAPCPLRAYQAHKRKPAPRIPRVPPVRRPRPVCVHATDTTLHWRCEAMAPSTEPTSKACDLVSVP